MTLKIAIIGADGQLGSDLCKIIDKSDQIPLTISDIDITDHDKAQKVLRSINPDIVINTAAYHKVDECEDRDIEAYKVNAHGAKNLALICKELDSKLAHISTDYVFDGEKDSPYTENDEPNPKTAYGISKLSGEQFIKYIWAEHFMIRTSGLYGTAGCMGKGGTNFVDGMIKRAKDKKEIKVVDDEVLTPTYTYHLAKKIVELVKASHYGLYHITNNGQCSWWEFTVKIFGLLKMDVKIEKITGGSLKTKANRPKYSVLENYTLKKLKMDDLLQWDQALKEYLVEKGRIKK